MPVDQTQAVNIVCDNPACPGNPLDPHDRAGWTFITAEVYGDAPTQFVYCCADCAGSVDAPLADAEAAKEAAADDEQFPPPPPPAVTTEAEEPKARSKK